MLPRAGKDESRADCNWELSPDLISQFVELSIGMLFFVYTSLHKCSQVSTVL